MAEFNLNIGGPRDQARQNLNITIQNREGETYEASKEAILSAISALREAARVALPAAQADAIAKEANAIEEEAAKHSPRAEALEGFLRRIKSVAVSVGDAVPAVLDALGKVAAALGLS